MRDYEILELTPAETRDQGFYCLRNKRSEGFQARQRWMEACHGDGLKYFSIRNQEGRDLGFIEVISAEKAWRPVEAPGFLFVHCLAIMEKASRSQGAGTALVEAAARYAEEQGMAGMCAMTSSKGWMARSDLFHRLGFSQIQQKGRFELMVRQWNLLAPAPEMLDWTTGLNGLKGWNLWFADQCPWHRKSVRDLMDTARLLGLELQVHPAQSCGEARSIPSGSGVFALTFDEQLLADHYISQTRFKNILRELEAKRKG